MLYLFLSTIESKDGKAKFETIYNEYSQKMMNVAFSVTKDSYDAEEAMHIALFSIAQKIDDIKTDNEAMLRSYLYKTVKNTAINIMVKKKKEIPFISLTEDTPGIPTENLVETIIEKEKYIRLVNVIKNAPQACRDVLVFYYLHKLKISEISFIMKKPRGTVKSLLYRGTKLLLKVLNDEVIE